MARRKSRRQDESFPHHPGREGGREGDRVGRETEITIESEGDNFEGDGVLGEGVGGEQPPNTVISSPPSIISLSPKPATASSAPFTSCACVYAGVSVICFFLFFIFFNVCARKRGSF